MGKSPILIHLNQPVYLIVLISPPLFPVALSIPDTIWTGNEQVNKYRIFLALPRNLKAKYPVLCRLRKKVLSRRLPNRSELGIPIQILMIPILSHLISLRPRHQGIVTHMIPAATFLSRNCPLQITLKTFLLMKHHIGSLLLHHQLTQNRIIPTPRLRSHPSIKFLAPYLETRD